MSVAERSAPRAPAAVGVAATNERGLDGLAAVLAGALGRDFPLPIDCYDGSHLGPDTAGARLVVRSPDAVRYVLTAPGELGFARAYVAGALDVEGDMFEVLGLRDHLPDIRVGGRQWLALARLASVGGLRVPPVPSEEARLRGRRHTPARDAAAIAHHYDVSNDFYRLVLGPSMTYSCAVWSTPDVSLEDAQAAKYELVCRKLGLRPGMTLLDVGCGWGGMVRYAARNHGVRAVGVTLSQNQAVGAREAVAADGLSDRVVIRVQDYRDVRDGPYDAISSIGMFEHVGLTRLGEYFGRLQALVRPGGRVLNHGITRPPGDRPRFAPRSFINRYVFPDGELHEVGAVVSQMQAAKFEVRHVENLREHYALTLRAWVANLEQTWDAAVREVGAGRARVWRLYMAASALNFEAARIQVHQILAVRSEDGRGGMPLRPDWDRTQLNPPVRR